MRILEKVFGSSALIAGLFLLGAPEHARAQGWERSTPGAEGMDAAPLIALDSAIRADAYGGVNRLVVVRDGKLVFSKRYPRDYRALSAGFDMRPHQFNY